jgi:hypothetical protein
MSVTATTLRRRFVTAPGYTGERRRLQRWEWLAATFPDIGSMDVLDLGGTAFSWMRGPVRPASVHIVNLEAQDGDLPPWIRTAVGDACDLPAAAKGHYDLVYSNSVIEHVGGHHQRQRFADTVHAMAPAHWVQAPYRYFPVEPHWLCPGFQFLPLPARGFLARRWPLRPATPESQKAAVRDVLDVELPSRSEMRLYFPGSQILAELAFGLPKSLIAVRGGSAVLSSGRNIRMST